MSSSFKTFNRAWQEYFQWGFQSCSKARPNPKDKLEGDFPEQKTRREWPRKRITYREITSARRQDTPGGRPRGTCFTCCRYKVILNWFAFSVCAHNGAIGTFKSCLLGITNYSITSFPSLGQRILLVRKKQQPKNSYSFAPKLPWNGFS